jgi:dihydrofolate reductase
MEDETLPKVLEAYRYVGLATDQIFQAMRLTQSHGEYGELKTFFDSLTSLHSDLKDTMQQNSTNPDPDQGG